MRCHRLPEPGDRIRFALGDWVDSRSGTVRARHKTAPEVGESNTLFFVEDGDGFFWHVGTPLDARGRRHGNRLEWWTFLDGVR